MTTPDSLEILIPILQLDVLHRANCRIKTPVCISWGQKLTFYFCEIFPKCFNLSQVPMFRQSKFSELLSLKHLQDARSPHTHTKTAEKNHRACALRAFFSTSLLFCRKSKLCLGLKIFLVISAENLPSKYLLSYHIQPCRKLSPAKHSQQSEVWTICLTLFITMKCVPITAHHLNEESISKSNWELKVLMLLSCLSKEHMDWGQSTC